MLVAAAALTAFTVFDGEPPWSALPLVAGAGLAAALPLTLRARLPLTGALLSAAIALFGLMIPGWQGRLVTMVMFGVAAFRLPRRAWLVMGLSIGWTTGYGLLIPQGQAGLSVVTDLVIMGVAPVAVGLALRLHGERAAQEARLDHAEASRAMAEAGRAMAEANRAMAEERAALARDVHDSVGHHLTAIRMQATATRRALRGQAQTADRALGTIAELSATALTEVRTLLDALRETPTGPDLEDLESLAERISTPRLPISLHRAGSGVTPPPAVGHTVYRVVQEALTNAARHSGASHVDVHLLCDPAAVTVTITDDGHGRTGAEGRGIRGMRERVDRHGGTFTAGPQQHHGWRVEAVVPIGPAGERKAA
uniref:histidine kinase n=1 Tax=Nonomuraea gerenzanensis TaxID=93944 RepID=A0A1M4EDR5_9ACTN|nr:Two-component system sensor kinase [Nonomuraea gerenzanensis]